MKVKLKNINNCYGSLKDGAIHDACVNISNNACYVCDSDSVFWFLCENQFDLIQEEETVDASYSLETVDELTKFIDAFNKLNIGEIKFK